MYTLSMGILAYAMIIVCIAERVIIIHVYVCEFVLTGTLKRILTLCRNSLKKLQTTPPRLQAKRGCLEC